MNQYVARLCWNTANWTRPTGDCVKAEHKTYVTENGYGHEEWLFNFQWILDGWKYGFLQPVNHSYEKMHGQAIDVRLYTLSQRSEWFYVGRIPACEVITEEQAEAARSAFRRNGWLKDMEAQAKAIGGDVKGLRYKEPQVIFNLRFRPNNYELYDPMVPVGVHDGIRKLRRYLLVELDDSHRTIDTEWQSRVGTNRLKSTGKQTRKASKPVVTDQVHNQLQNELFLLLRKQYGASAVVMEEDYADVKLRRNDMVDLFEIKSDPRPTKAIREALGQLLEYGYVCKQNGYKVGQLVVAAPGELGARDKEYLHHLRTTCSLPIQYICLRMGMRELDLPW